MIIDSHAHVMLPTEKQLLMMEEAGVDKTILFSTTPHPEKAHDLKSLEKELAILNNVLASSTSLKELIQLSKKYPKVPLILGHMGGIHWLDVIKLAKENRNIYLDLSATFTILAPKIAINELPERTLFSSDAPYGNPLLFRRMIEMVSPDKKALEQVLGGNIIELLKL